MIEDRHTFYDFFKEFISNSFPSFVSDYFIVQKHDVRNYNIRNSDSNIRKGEIRVNQARVLL